MLKKVGVAGLLLFASSAQAAFITGSLSFTDGGLNIPVLPSMSIVSQLGTPGQNPITQGTPSVFSCTGDFMVGAPCALAPPPTTGPVDFLSTTGVVYTYDGFTFNLNGISGITRTPLAATGVGTALADSLSFLLSGVVSGGAFSPTAFAGIWTGQGACLGSTAAPPCTSNASASWSVSLTAQGGRVPEPSILALLGLGLLGFAATRRSKPTNN